MYIDIRKCDACQAAKLLLLPIHYSSARDSVSDLIALRRVSGGAAFDRGTAGRSSVKQTQIGIFLRREAPREARGGLKAEPKSADLVKPEDL